MSFKRIELGSFQPTAMVAPAKLKDIVADHLRPVALITERLDSWYKGRSYDGEFCFEVSFEEGLRFIPGTFVSYLAIWHNRRCVFEVQNAHMCVKPDIDTWSAFTEPLIERLKSFSPAIASIDAMFR